MIDFRCNSKIFTIIAKISLFIAKIPLFIAKICYSEISL